MATEAPRNPLPDELAPAAGNLAGVLRGLVFSRATGRCQITGCGDRAAFVSCTLLASLRGGKAGINWSAICLKHSVMFATATNTPKP